MSADRLRAARRRVPADILASVFVGGCLGGWARYGITAHWTVGAASIPWPVVVVNASGALLLALIVVLAGELAPSRYARPLLGTGFCGAFTTFSSVVVDADELTAHGHAGTAAAYLVVTIATGLLLGAAGWLGARAVLVRHRRGRAERRLT